MPILKKQTWIHNLHYTQKLTQRIINLKVRNKLTELLEENIEEILVTLLLSKISQIECKSTNYKRKK